MKKLGDEMNSFRIFTDSRVLKENKPTVHRLNSLKNKDLRSGVDPDSLRSSGQARLPVPKIKFKHLSLGWDGLLRELILQYTFYFFSLLYLFLF